MVNPSPRTLDAAAQVNRGRGKISRTLFSSLPRGTPAAAIQHLDFRVRQR
jgi:hypothetical protein